jgi:hypothetical protein
MMKSKMSSLLVENELLGERNMSGNNEGVFTVNEAALRRRGNCVSTERSRETAMAFVCQQSSAIDRADILRHVGGCRPRNIAG